MIEVFPKKIDEGKLQANLKKLVSAFLMVAEEQVQEGIEPLSMPLSLNCKTRKKDLIEINK